MQVEARQRGTGFDQAPFTRPHQEFSIGVLTGNICIEIDGITGSYFSFGCRKTQIVRLIPVESDLGGVGKATLLTLIDIEAYFTVLFYIGHYGTNSLDVVH